MCIRDRIYTKLEEAFTSYKSALSHYQAYEDLDAKKGFDNAVKILNKIDQSILEEPEYNSWKSDYIELAQSVAKDYIITQADLTAVSYTHLDVYKRQD